MSERQGIILCGHGSRDEGAIREFSHVVGAVSSHFPDLPVSYGYLEFARPVIRTGLDQLCEQGVTRILAIPGMLFAAGHVKNDIPSVLNEYRAQHPDIRIDYGGILGADPRLIRAGGARVAEALALCRDSVPLHETLLLVVGRGTSDPDANAHISRVMRLLWEGMGFGWGEAAYSGVTFPLVGAALAHAVKLGYRRIIVFPYFLFTGILVRRIYDTVDALAASHSEIEFVKAPYLNDHPLVVEAFAARVHEILAGENRMDCSACKYREIVLGFEEERGQAQHGHHHHVEGIGTGMHAHGHYHGDQLHDHTPYPHANHPHGPMSMKKIF